MKKGLSSLPGKISSFLGRDKPKPNIPHRITIAEFVKKRNGSTSFCKNDNKKDETIDYL